MLVYNIQLKHHIFGHNNIFVLTVVQMLKWPYINSTLVWFYSGS